MIVKHNTLALCLSFLTIAVTNFAGSRPVLVYQPPLKDWVPVLGYDESYIGDDCGYVKGEPCIVLKGNKTKTVIFSSPPVSEDPIQPNETFLFSALVKCTPSDISSIMGIDYTQIYYANANKTARDNGWTEVSSLIRASEKSSRKLYVQLYKKDGVCMFDQVRLTRVDVAEVTEDPEYGALAFGETVKTDGTFESKIFTDNFLGTYSPRLTRFTAQWKSSVLSVNTGDNVTFDYSGVKPEFKTPLFVKIYVVYKYKTTALVLSKSADGLNWIDANTLAAGWNNFSLGSTEHKYFSIRMPANTESAVMQISSIIVESTVKPRVKGDLHGKHVILVPTHEDSEKGVSISITKEEEDEEEAIRFTMKSDKESADIAFDYSLHGFTGPSFVLDKTSGHISTNEEFSTMVTATLSSSDNVVGDYSVYDTNSGASLCSGYIITSQLHVLDDSSYGEVLGNNDDSSGGTLWWCGSMYKVSKGRKAPKQKGERVQLYAAKNEYEPFQLVFKAGDKDKVITDISLNELVHIGSNGENSDAITNITIRRVMYLKTDHKTDKEYGRDGEYWPDPLVPTSFPYTCPAGENCVFWVLVYVPANASQGDYEGTVSFTLDGGRVLSGKVSLTVWNFVIPKKTRLKSLLGYSPDMINLYHHIKYANKSVKHELYYKYYESYSRHRLSPMYAFYLYPPYAYFSKDDEYHVDFSTFKKHVDELYSENGFGFSSDVM